MAQRMLLGPGNDDMRIQRAFGLVIGRSASAKEMTILKTALSGFQQRYANDEAAAKKLVMVGDAPQTPNQRVSDQAAWMLLCSTLMNTDEFLTVH